MLLEPRVDFHGDFLGHRTGHETLLCVFGNPRDDFLQREVAKAVGEGAFMRDIRKRLSGSSVGYSLHPIVGTAQEIAHTPGLLENLHTMYEITHVGTIRPLPRSNQTPSVGQYLNMLYGLNPNGTPKTLH